MNTEKNAIINEKKSVTVLFRVSAGETWTRNKYMNQMPANNRDVILEQCQA